MRNKKNIILLSLLAILWLPTIITIVLCSVGIIANKLLFNTLIGVFIILTTLILLIISFSFSKKPLKEFSIITKGIKLTIIKYPKSIYLFTNTTILSQISNPDYTKDIILSGVYKRLNIEAIWHPNDNKDIIIDKEEIYTDRIKEIKHYEDILPNDNINRKIPRVVVPKSTLAYNLSKKSKK